MQRGTNEAKDSGPNQNPAVPDSSQVSLPNTHTHTHIHAHTMHSSLWPAVALTQPWLPDSWQLRGRAGGKNVRALQHPTCSHHNHMQSRTPSPGHRLWGSGQVSSPRRKTSLLATLLCRLGKKMKRFFLRLPGALGQSCIS